MGNRAVIITKENFENNGIGIYVHWNGGRDSIEGFLKYCEIRGFRAPDVDCYGWARLAQVIANFMGDDGLSVGIDTVNHLDCDNGDNGTYIIKGWEIVDREYFRYSEQNEYSLQDMLEAIDEAQPRPIGKDYWNAEEVPTAELKKGDKIVVKTWRGEFKTLTVKGFGANKYLNGTNVYKMPYTDECGTGDRDNVNNYYRQATARRVKGE